MSEKKHYLLKLIPPRSTFMQDMSADERSIMQAHVQYWSPYVEDGTMLLMGPVMDPRGGYGLGVIGVDSEERLNVLLAGDPAAKINRYEITPMRVRTKA